MGVEQPNNSAKRELSPSKVKEQGVGAKDENRSLLDTIGQLNKSVVENTRQEQNRRDEEDKRRISEAKKQAELSKEESRLREKRLAEITAKEKDRKQLLAEQSKKDINERIVFADRLFGQITFDPSERFILAKSVKDLGVSIGLSGKDYEPIRELHKNKKWYELINYFPDVKYHIPPRKVDIVTGARDLNSKSKTVAVIEGNVDFNGIGQLQKTGSKKPTLSYLFFPVGVDGEFLDWSENNPVSWFYYKDRGPTESDKRTYFEKLCDRYLINVLTVRSEFAGSTRSTKAESFAVQLPDKNGWYFGDNFQGRYIFFAEYNTNDEIRGLDFSGRMLSPVLESYYKTLMDRLLKKAVTLKKKLDLGETDLDTAIREMQDLYVQLFKETVRWADSH